jgi:hypothetical protein
MVFQCLLTLFIHIQNIIHLQCSGGDFLYYDSFSFFNLHFNYETLFSLHPNF